MSEGETLREFVARHRHLSPEAALEAVLAQPKVQTWLAPDPTRRLRLEAEFHRLWNEGAGQANGGAAVEAVVRPRGPRTVEPARPHVGPAHLRVDETTARPAPPATVVRSRHEKFLCTSCGGYDIHSEADGEAVRVRCRQCKAEYPDLLQLVPVVEVGPFELFFGRGREAWLKAGALVTVWVAAALLLKLIV